MRLDTNVYDLTRDLASPMAGRLVPWPCFEEHIAFGRSDTRFATKRAAALSPHAFTHMDLPSALESSDADQPQSYVGVTTFRQAQRFLARFSQPQEYATAYLIDVTKFRKRVCEHLARTPESYRIHGLLSPHLTASDYEEIAAELEIKDAWLRTQLAGIEPNSAVLLFSGCASDFSQYPYPQIASHPAFEALHVSFLHPYLSADAARFLRDEARVSLIGIDAYGLDGFPFFINPLFCYKPALLPGRAGEVQPAHDTFLGKESKIRMVESWECRSPDLRQKIMSDSSVKGRLLVVPLDMSIIIDALLLKILFRIEQE